MDVSGFIKANSDQLNSDDLLSGPITVRIEGVKRGSKEQPVKIQISGGHREWRPCKTCLRILVAAHDTAESDKWVGTWVKLYRDPDVKFGGIEVGGIRIAAMSCVERKATLNLTETRGRKAQWVIQPLKPPASSEPSKADHLARIRHLLTQIEDPTYEEKLVAKFGALEKMSEEAARKCVERLEQLAGGEKERAATDTDESGDSEASPVGGGASEPAILAAIERRAAAFNEPDAAREALLCWWQDSDVATAEALKMIPNAKVNTRDGTVSF